MKAKDSAELQANNTLSVEAGGMQTKHHETPEEN
jgi:hypothetical protein